MIGNSCHVCGAQLKREQTWKVEKKEAPGLKIKGLSECVCVGRGVNRGRVNVGIPGTVALSSHGSLSRCRQFWRVGVINSEV